MNFKPKEIKTPKLVLKLEIELIDSTYTEEEAFNRLQYLLNSSNFKEFSAFIVALLRETRSSMWDNPNLELHAYKEKDETKS